MTGFFYLFNHILFSVCLFFCFFYNFIGWMDQDDEKFLTEVFAQLTDEATDDSKRRELVSKA